jgi:phage host-nuclease inhibitor protein Gam
LFNLVDNISQKNESLEVELTDSDKKKLNFTVNNLMQYQYGDILVTVNNIPRTYFLANEHFNNLIRSVDAQEKQFKILQKKITDLVEHPEKYSVNIFDEITKEISILDNRILDYSHAWGRFDLSLNDTKTKNATELVMGIKDFKAQMKMLFLRNVETLSLELDNYFLKHFEDDEFKKIRVGDKTYSDYKEFIKDFKNLMRDEK